MSKGFFDGPVKSVSAATPASGALAAAAAATDDDEAEGWDVEDVDVDGLLLSDIPKFGMADLLAVGTGKAATANADDDEAEGEGWGGDDDLDLGEVEVDETPATSAFV